MRKGTIRTGMNFVTAGIGSLILATFFHEEVARVLSLSPGSEAEFVVLGLFWGGVLGILGISIVTLGFLRSAAAEGVSLVPSMIILAAAVFLFFVLLFTSLTAPKAPRLRPGDTITI